MNSDSLYKINFIAYSEALQGLNNYNGKVASIAFVNWWLMKHTGLKDQSIVDLTNSCCGNKPCINMVADCEFPIVHYFKDCFNRLDELTQIHKYEEYFKKELLYYKNFDGDNTKVEAWVKKSEAIVNENFGLFSLKYLDYAEKPNHLKINLPENYGLEFSVTRNEFNYTIEFLELFNELYYRQDQ